MKNKRILVALTLVLAILLAQACNIKEPGKREVADETEETEITISFDDLENTESEESESEDLKTSEEEEAEKESVSEEAQETEAFSYDLADIDGLSAKTDYIFDLVYNDSLHTLEGKVEANILNCSGDSWDKLVFEDWATSDYLKTLGVSNYAPTKFFDSAITIDGTTTETSFTRGDDVSSVIFDIPTEIKDGEEVTFKTSFVVTVPRLAYRYGYSMDKDSEKVNLGNALPVLALYKDGKWQTHPYVGLGESFNSETANYKVSLKCNPKYLVAMTGNESFEGQKYVSEQKCVRDFAIMLTSNAAVLREVVDGRVISVYGSSEKKDDFHGYIEEAANVISFYEKIIGPYPYDSLDICIVDFEGIAGGMEYPNLITVSNDVSESADLIPHEIAHQWFYLLIGNDEHETAWIDEGFSSYLVNLYLKEKKGINFTDSGVTMMLPQLNIPAGQNGSILAFYVFAPDFLYFVQERIGDEAFYNSLKEIYDTYLFKQVQTEDILEVFRSNTSEDIEDIIDTYFVLN